MAIAIILVIVLVTVTFPFLTETQIKVSTEVNTIENVSVETPSIPLIAKLFPPSYERGAYTIQVKVTKNGIDVFNATIKDVPSGEYVFVWIRNGIPEEGAYHIVVYLFRGSVDVDTYPLDVEF